MKKHWRVLVGVIAAIGIGACIWLWPVIRAFMKIGIPEGPEMRQYQGTIEGNLKAIRTALVLYHENEDHFPEAAGWMDAIEKQLKTNDLTVEEAAKKLRNPAKPSEYGYAINDAVAGKFKGDIEKPETVLVFEVAPGARNAHGDPKTAKGQGITLNGSIVKLP